METIEAEAQEEKRVEEIEGGIEAKLAEGGSAEEQEVAADDGKQAHGQHGVCVRGSSAGVCWCPRATGRMLS